MELYSTLNNVKIDKVTINTDYKFELNVNHNENVELSFYSDYQYFTYKFEDINDFLKQYKRQEKNLFKYFFNDSTVNFDDLNIHLQDDEFTNIESEIFIHAEVLSENESFMISEYYNLMVNDMLLPCNTGDGSLEYVLLDTWSFANGEWWEDAINFIAMNCDLEDYDLPTLRKLIENDELKYIEENRTLTELEEDLIKLAKKYNK